MSATAENRIYVYMLFAAAENLNSLVSFKFTFIVC